ncbi:hypothetical protein, partial [Leucobacter sp. M11]|uniref:hypothetical protein n=1 Tax=Leucobacter sp. M11 TaxID=2993565 RepID=UPI002DAF249A|nr:MFS transporter [Leucobacter sp. M11]
PILASWISESGGAGYQIGMMLACFGVLSTVCLLFLAETQKGSLASAAEPSGKERRS